MTLEGCTLVRTAEKFEPGTPNLVGAVGLMAACDFYEQYAVYDMLAQKHQDWKMYYEQIQSMLGGDRMIGACDSKSIGILSLKFNDPYTCGEILANENVCVRVGGHCAHPLLEYLGVEK